MKKIPKKWRELPKDERLKIPIDCFGIDEKTIKQIRNIPDTKKRLIEAARIQYEMFNDIHSYLTVWIAGYGSDVIIRQKFGSTQNLLNHFFTKTEFPAGIAPSWADIKRRIKVPEEMTPELAEEIGIHIGDGNLFIATDKQGSRSYRYGISGDLINEYLYHAEHINKLMKGLYNLSPCLIKREDKNCIESAYKSKAIVQFKNNILELPIGPKTEIKIPKKILGDKELQKSCMAGIIDTDFSLTQCLAITGKLNSLFITKEMHKILDENNISHKYKLYNEYGRFYIQREGAIKIIEEWKLNNVKHLSKYRMLNEFGKFIPFSTTPERLAVLEGKLDIKELEKVCVKRKGPR